MSVAMRCDELLSEGDDDELVDIERFDPDFRLSSGLVRGGVGDGPALFELSKVETGPLLVIIIDF